METHSFFLVVGIVILIGFTGRLMRQRSMIPESLFLIIFGLLLGPVFGIVPGKDMLAYLPVVSIAAMVAILIESGIEFDISKLKGLLQKTVLFTFMVAIFTTAIVAGVLHFFFNWQIWHAALLGLISSGTTTITSMALLRSIDVSNRIRRLILLETIINDFTLILGTFLIVEIIGLKELSLGEAAGTLLSGFSIAIIFGLVASSFWRFVLTRISRKKELSYASTLGICFVIYFLVDYIGGNPIIAIFTFSLLLGNYCRMFKFIKPSGKPEKGDSIEASIRSIKSVQTDMTFFLASSFFVLLGITFDPALLEKVSILVITAIIGIILLVRYVSASVLSMLEQAYSEYKMIITIMIPRGYVAAVLAFVPAQEGIEIPLITDVIVILIITTTLIAIFGTMAYAMIRKGR